jgi:rare lipoprotein A
MKVRSGIPASRFAALAVVTGLLQACTVSTPTGDGPPRDGAAPELPDDPVPRAEPRSRYGNPASYVVFGNRYYVLRSSAGYRERGIASWYGRKFHGRRTSSGETYDMHRMTAAHKSLPLPTFVEVTNLKNARRVVVRVNDRGPFHDNRIIDLSYAAARKLGILGEGTGLVEVRAITPGEAPRQRAADPPTRTDETASTPAAPKIYLQAGSFAQRDNAERLRARLTSLPGVEIELHEVVLDRGRVFRVRIGPIADVASADRLSSDMVGAGLELPRIVIE